MEDNFFKFGKATFGSRKTDGDLLTADVEEDVYDALNNETFGDAVFDGDWEEAHEKLSELVVPGKVSPVISYSHSHKSISNLDRDCLSDHFENGSKELIQQSLSHLGLEDDLDDTAISSYGKGAPPQEINSGYKRSIESIFCSSTAFPAIIESQECGSPKTRSIWSTDQEISTSSQAPEIKLDSLLKSLQTAHSVNPPFHYQQNPLPKLQHPSPSIVQAKTSPSPSLPVTARLLEDIERDLLLNNGNPNNGHRPPEPYAGWTRPMAVRAEQLEEELLRGRTPPVPPLTPQGMGDQKWNPLVDLGLGGKGWNDCQTPPLPISANVMTVDDLERDILPRPRVQTVEDVERFLQGASPVHLEANQSKMVFSNHLPHPPNNSWGQVARNIPQPPIGTPPQSSGMFGSFGGNNCTSPVSVSSFGERQSPMVISSPLGPQNYAPIMHPAMKAQRMNSSYPGGLRNKVGNSHMVHPAMVLAERMIYPRQIHHPLLNKHWMPHPDMSQHPAFNQAFRERNNIHRNSFSQSDDYSGLMTQREKEWLIKIQMMQVHTDNPYVDDYYHTTYIMRKMIREKMKTDKGGDDVKLVLPEMRIHGNKAYVPVQFENSLGKLQAISVNFPRKVLELEGHLTVAEEDNRLPANKELHRQRRLLLDIEKLYSVLLEVDDEEKRMLALPEVAQLPHQEKREKMIDLLFESLGCANPSNPEEKFSQIGVIRKGRHLILRAMVLLDQSRQVDLLASLFHCIGSVVRRDTNDRILNQYLNEVLKIIDRSSFRELVTLGQGLRNGHPFESSHPNATAFSRERGNYLAALHSKFGVTVLCRLFFQAEKKYLDQTELKNDLEIEWKRVIHHLVDCIGSSLPDLSFHDSVNPHLFAHLERFALDKDKVAVLRLKAHSLPTLSGTP